VITWITQLRLELRLRMLLLLWLLLLRLRPCNLQLRGLPLRREGILATVLQSRRIAWGWLRHRRDHSLLWLRWWLRSSLSLHLFFPGLRGLLLL